MIVVQTQLYKRNNLQNLSLTKTVLPRCKCNLFVSWNELFLNITYFWKEIATEASMMAHVTYLHLCWQITSSFFCEEFSCLCNVSPWNGGFWEQFPGQSFYPESKLMDVCSGFESPESSPSLPSYACLSFINDCWAAFRLQQFCRTILVHCIYFKHKIFVVVNKNKVFVFLI